MTRIPKWFTTVLIGLALTALMGACGSSAKSGSAAKAGGTGGATITIHNFTFSPAVLQVKAGTKVTVKNADDTDHTVTAIDGSFDTGAIHGGKSATFTVSKSGTAKYHCNIHNYMNGTIQVTG
jgi:plastocyanin